MTTDAQRVPTDVLDRIRASFDSGSEWTKATAKVAFGLDERRFRAAVSQLRESGYPVVSEDRAGSTYRKARSREELDTFIEAVLMSRARDLEQQIRVLREGADRHFGSSQLRLAV